MLVNRFVLVSCINKARTIPDKIIYCELLKVFYKLLEQERINGSFIKDFHYYDSVSSDSITFYSGFINSQAIKLS